MSDEVNEVTQADERSPAQFFFEMGFGACYAEAMIRGGDKVPFPISDDFMEQQWIISQEAYEDPSELDAMLALTAASQASAGEGLRIARGIVEADLADAKEHCDADWIGLSQAALDAIDATLTTPVEASQPVGDAGEAMSKRTFLTCVSGDGPQPYLKVHFNNLADAHAAHDELLGRKGES